MRKIQTNYEGWPDCCKPANEFLSRPRQAVIAGYVSYPEALRTSDQSNENSEEYMDDLLFNFKLALTLNVIIRCA